MKSTKTAQKGLSPGERSEKHNGRNKQRKQNTAPFWPPSREKRVTAKGSQPHRTSELGKRTASSARLQRNPRWGLHGPCAPASHPKALAVVPGGRGRRDVCVVCACERGSWDVWREQWCPLITPPNAEHAHLSRLTPRALSTGQLKPTEVRQLAQRVRDGARAGTQQGPRAVTAQSQPQ